MSLLQRAFLTLGGLGLVVSLPTTVLGQGSDSSSHYAPQGGEYSPAGVIAGDQAKASVSLGLSGGYLVWQDNATDGDGLGISAVRLDGTFSPTLGNFRVNQNGTNDQENPQVALLQGGGAAFVWQSGKLSFQHIMARFLSSSNLWITGDVTVNTATNYQLDPAIATLTNGNVVITWGSYGQDNADGFQGVYGQIMTPTGQKVGNEFRINQTTPFNQRTPAVAAFPNGQFIVAWVSELQRFSQFASPSSGVLGSLGPATTSQESVDIYARIFNANGTPAGGEFLVNTSSNTCANPTVAVATDGSYEIAWSQKDTAVVNNSWDIFARHFNAAGTGDASASVVNSQRYGDQYGPKISAVGTDYLVVWTSMAQDGSHEGVFGQFLKGDGTPVGGEFRVNTTVLNQQIYPAVASDGSERFLAVWSSYSSLASGLDLKAQQYASTLQPLVAPDPPIVNALDSFSLGVSWSPVADASYYELFVDGSVTPVMVTNDMWSEQDFNPGTKHTFQLAYVLADGRVSPVSTTASGTTWGADRNFDGLPDDWETKYYGTNKNNWPKNGAQTVLAPGVTVLQVFLWGADPTNPSTWLKQTITKTSEGFFLNWNTVPGGIYQILTTTDLQNWSNLGSPRYEAGTSDQVFLGKSPSGYYQIVRFRY